MPIPNSQLSTWSSQGSQVRSQRTYESIRRALDPHFWPAAMGQPSVYLQGSYRNHTNIAGDSDVDVVAESANLFYSNLTVEQRHAMGLQPGGFTWTDFRDEVQAVLEDHYSPGKVRPGDKCIHVGGSGERLNADVVPCTEYRRYLPSGGYAKGITFWTRSTGVQVVNYPELHYANGTRRNHACSGNYKRMIRVFKNARNAAGSNFPSYFMECLLYNVPVHRFSGGYHTMFHGVLTDLLAARQNGSMAGWTCQNGQQQMFGTAVHQIRVAAAYACIDALVDLWNEW